MATYHCSINSVSRSEGRSSVAAASYRSADKLLDERTGITSDYTRKKGVEHSEIVLPKGVNAEWALDRQMLWNAAELSEKRKDSRVAREVEVSLPHELNEQERLTLTKNFSQYLSDQYKVAVDFAIHKPHDRSDERNFHAHILMTTREISEQGLTKKSVFEKDMRWLLANNLPTARMQYKAVREQWANFANKALEEKGLNIRIDHRSFEDQGIALAPTQHVGVQASRMQDRGVETERQRLDPQDAKYNTQLIQEHPEEIFKVITAQKSVFTQHDLAKAVHRYTDNLADYQSCMAKVMAAPDLVKLRSEQDKQLAVFSTRQQIDLEQDLIQRAESLFGQKTHAVSEEHVNQAIEKQDAEIRHITGTVGLADEQRFAIEAVTSSERLAVIEGLAGAGKSTLLAAAKEAWQAAGYQVVGAALSGKAAEGLEESSGISSRTLAFWEHSFNNQRDRLNNKTVFVIDEAGMVSSKQLTRFIERVDKTGGKLVLVGDSEQLQPINAGAPFRAITERVDTAGLIGIRRQKVDWQRGASVDFAQLRTAEGIAAYADQQRIVFAQSAESVSQSLVRDYVADIQNNPKDSRIALAHRRKDVFSINQQVRQSLQEKGLLSKGELSGELPYQTASGNRKFSVGDRLVFLENDRALGVKNGLLGQVIETKSDYLHVRLDGTEREVVIPTQEYQAFDHGYATTIHKSQGATVDRCFVMASSTMDRHLTYVAMTRHRQDARLYADGETFANTAALSEQLGRSGAQSMALDYLKVDLSVPVRTNSGVRGPFETALNSYTLSYHSIARQQEKGLPVLPNQKRSLKQAGEQLEKARPGTLAVIKETLAGSAEARSLAAAQPGREKTDRLLAMMRNTYEGKPCNNASGKPLEQSDSQPKDGLFSKKSRDTASLTASQTVTKSGLSGKAIELAIDGYAVALHSIMKQSEKGLPILPNQRKQLESAGMALETLKPGTVDSLRATIQHDPRAQEMMGSGAGRERARGLIEYMAQGDGVKREAEIKAQQAKEQERSRGWER
jgi:Ti-type conjugative transfer relaxase TraA